MEFCGQEMLACAYAKAILVSPQLYAYMPKILYQYVENGG